MRRCCPALTTAAPRLLTTGPLRFPSRQSELSCFAVQPKTDILGSAEIRLLVETFYTRVNQDPILGPIFNDVAKVNWDEHIPLLCRFWNTLLFRTGEYRGNAFGKHQLLPVGKEHFTTWLALFRKTIDDLFEGPKAEEAKGYAASIADSFQLKLGLLKIEDFLGKGIPISVKN